MGRLQGVTGKSCTSVACRMSLVKLISDSIQIMPGYLAVTSMNIAGLWKRRILDMIPTNQYSSNPIIFDRTMPIMSKPNCYRTLGRLKEVNGTVFRWSRLSRLDERFFITKVKDKSFERRICPRFMASGQIIKKSSSHYK